MSPSLLLVAVVLAGADGGTPRPACPTGFERLVDGACLSTPAGKPKGPVPLVVYFHGMVPEHVVFDASSELGRLGAEAKKRNVAVLALVGEQGLCHWAADVQHHWCWPSEKRQLDTAQALEARLALALELAKARLGAVGTPVLAGFSNGGFYVALLATESKVPASAYAVLHAGAVAGQRFEPSRTRRTLVLTAKGDEWQRPKAEAFAAAAADAGWPVQLEVRDGGHALEPGDVRRVVDFALAAPTK